MAKKSDDNPTLNLTSDTTIEQDRAIAKIAEGLVELGICEQDAMDQAEDFKSYAEICQHMDAAAAF